MASIHRKRGASGKVSPYWQAKFRSADGSTVWRSTKQTDSRKAIEVARNWEKAARLAASSELTQAASIRLLDELMEATIGENLEVGFVTVLFRGWLTPKCQPTCANKLSGIPATTSERSITLLE
jgi:hypothetical protein